MTPQEKFKQWYEKIFRKENMHKMTTLSILPNAEKQKKAARRKLGILGYAFLWLFGRPWVDHEDPQPDKLGTPFRSFHIPRNYWKVDFCYGLLVAHRRYAPNALHRGMQRLAFGVKWHCLAHETHDKLDNSEKLT